MNINCHQVHDHVVIIGVSLLKMPKQKICTIKQEVVFYNISTPFISSSSVTAVANLTREKNRQKLSVNRDI